MPLLLAFEAEFMPTVASNFRVLLASLNIEIAVLIRAPNLIRVRINFYILTEFVILLHYFFCAKSFHIHWREAFLTAHVWAPECTHLAV
jgi:hypothetical protein